MHFVAAHLNGIGGLAYAAAIVAVSAAEPGVLVLVGQLIIATIVTFGYWLNRRKVQEIHVLVNRHTDELNNRVDQLVKTLTDAGIEVPPDAR
jgi:hypothetical protein